MSLDVTSPGTADASAFMQGMTRRQRTAWRLRLDGLDVETIRRRLDVSPRAIRRLLQRGIVRAQRRIETGPNKATRGRR